MAPSVKAFLPLLTVLGATAAAAVAAQKYAPKYMATKYRRRMQSQRMDDIIRSEPEVEHESSLINDEEKPTIQRKRSPSSLVVMTVLQDVHLMMSVFGLCVMVLVVLVSLVVVMIKEDVASPNDLQLFAPLMMVAMGLIFLGLFVRTLKGTTTNYSMSTTKAPRIRISNDQEKNDREMGSPVEKRVSKCPFGFG